MILVLQREHPPESLAEILRAVESLGLRCDLSRGEEQIVVGLSGACDLEALERALSEHRDVDVVPLLSAAEYKRLRTRRRLMGGMVAGLGLLTTGAAARPLVGFLLPPKGLLTDPNLVRAGALDDIHELSARQVMLLGKPVLLVRLEHGRFYAVSAICTHMNTCVLEWKADRRELVCPCHGGAFDVHGNVVQGPPSTPLASFATEEIRGEIFIRREG